MRASLCLCFILFFFAFAFAGKLQLKIIEKERRKRKRKVINDDLATFDSQAVATARCNATLTLERKFTWIQFYPPGTGAIYSLIVTNNGPCNLTQAHVFYSFSNPTSISVGRIYLQSTGRGGYYMTGFNYIAPGESYGAAGIFFFKK